MSPALHACALCVEGVCVCLWLGRGTNIGHIGNHNLKVAREEEKTGKMLIKLEEG